MSLGKVLWPLFITLSTWFIVIRHTPSKMRCIGFGGATGQMMFILTSLVSISLAFSTGIDSN